MNSVIEVSWTDTQSNRLLLLGAMIELFDVNELDHYVNVLMANGSQVCVQLPDAEQAIICEDACGFDVMAFSEIAPVSRVRF